MKIAYCSDVHLEMAPILLENSENADVLVLAGDICLAKVIDEYPSDILDLLASQNGRIHHFFDTCSERFKHIIYVFGNHEHYSYDIQNSMQRIKSCLSYIKNLHILERESVVIDDVTFLGATLWTDMNGGDENTLDEVGYSINDFRLITNSNKQQLDNVNEQTLSTAFDAPVKWSTLDAMVQFKKTVDWIDQVRELVDIKKLVIVTHHAPSFQSIHPSYVYDTISNGGYASDLDKFIQERPDILLWFHGHIHHKQDYVIGNTKILANPRGYKFKEVIADTFKLEYISI